jgi:hypothetical protein
MYSGKKHPEFKVTDELIAIMEYFGMSQGALMIYVKSCSSDGGVLEIPLRPNRVDEALKIFAECEDYTASISPRYTPRGLITIRIEQNQSVHDFIFPWKVQ